MHTARRPDGIPPAAARRPAPDWRWALIGSLVIVVVSCLPYLVAWAAAPAGYQFTGILVNPLDGHSYLAKMRQGWEGAWLFRLTYTPEPHAGAALYLFYLALGHIARLAGLPLVVVYHAARVLAGLGLLAMLYAFVARMTPGPRARRWLFGLTAATAGLGWLGSVVGLLPVDLWVPEAFAFFSLLTNPHFPLTLALMLAGVYGVLWPRRGLRRWLLPALCGAVLGAVSPFALAPLYAAFAVYLAWLAIETWRRDGLASVFVPSGVAALGLVVASAPWLAYDAWVVSSQPVFAGWSAQNVTPTPSLPDLLLGFGLLLPLTLVGAGEGVRQRDRAVVMLVIWAGVTLILLAAPWSLQRRLITGLGLPLALLAGWGAVRRYSRRCGGDAPHAVGAGEAVPHPLTPSPPPKLPGTSQAERGDAPPLHAVERGPGGEVGRASLLAKLVLSLGLLGSAFLLVIFPLGALARATARDATALFYVSDAEAAAMQWLAANARGAVVLAPPRCGTLLPGRAGVRVFYGHPFETVAAARRRAQAEAFFAGRLSDTDWRQMLQDDGVEYVLAVAADRAALEGRLNDLELVYQTGDTAIYRVRR